MPDRVAASHQIAVNIPGSAYTVTVGAGSLATLGPRIRELSAAATACVVTDANVATLYREIAEQSLRSVGFNVTTAALPTGESHKRLTTLLPVYDQFLSAGIDRQSPIIALGGGIVGDMAALLAGTLLRGIPFVQVPTTLLAMVDASVGGKGAVNTSAGKNLIGVFHQPIAVIVDTDLLKSLSDEQLRGGLAECIKHDAIRNADGFARLEASIDRALARDSDYLAGLVAHNVAIKARIVEADPHERGERALLNFGHTFGHAIEQTTNHAVSHGQAVALGMIAAARLSRDLKMLPDRDANRIEHLIAKAGLPTRRPDLSPQAMLQSMTVDKKSRAGKTRLILLEQLGCAVIRDDVPTAAIENAIASLRGSHGG